MSASNISIGEAELEIMKVIWNAKEPIGSAAIGEAVAQHGWKRTTIATFLARLTEKGAITSEKCGKAMMYSPLISVKDYRHAQVKSLIKNVFDGSAKELVASLFEEQSLSEEDIGELRAIFDD